MDMEQLQAFGFPVLLIIIFYFLLYRPQKKQQKKRQAMLESVKVGSRVVTVGGIYGEIMSINGERIRLKIADNVEIEVLDKDILEIGYLIENKKIRLDFKLV